MGEGGLLVCQLAGPWFVAGGYTGFGCLREFRGSDWAILWHGCIRAHAGRNASAQRQPVKLASIHSLQSMLPMNLMYSSQLKPEISPLDALLSTVCSIGEFLWMPFKYHAFLACLSTPQPTCLIPVFTELKKGSKRSVLEASSLPSAFPPLPQAPRPRLPCCHHRSW